MGSWWWWLLAMLVFVPACREPRSVPDLIADLRHPDAKERRRAADELSMANGVPAPAIGPLLAAISVELDPPAHGAMLITLGRSGVPEAKPHIDGAMLVPDPKVRRWAATALRFWLIANGQLAVDARLPKGWPYGQPGYPP